MYSTHTVTYCLLGGVWLLCHMMYDAGVSICTWTIHVLPLCQSNYGFLNCTVTKHGSTGHGCRDPLRYSLLLMTISLIISTQDCITPFNRRHIHICTDEEAGYEPHAHMYGHMHSPWAQKHTLIIATATLVSVMSC